jgi:hypothetical protein
MAAQEGRDGDDGLRNLSLLESAGAVLGQLPQMPAAVPDTSVAAEPPAGGAAQMAISILLLGDSELRDALQAAAKPSSWSLSFPIPRSPRPGRGTMITMIAVARCASR